MSDLTVVIPTLNEAFVLPALLEDLRGQSGVALQVVVADGGSTDGTPEVATRAGATLVSAPRGRGAQMNAGARAARAGMLLFLHADSRLESPTQLREALDALGAAGTRAAGHWPLRFARTRGGKELFYRYLEEKTALNRPGTINGDQGLMIGADYFRELGGFDQRLPFLEDPLIAAKVLASGQWTLLPGRLTTSARRFETEGERRRYTLMALIMGMHVAGADEFLAHSREIYATQGTTGRLKLGPALALAWRVLLEAGWRRACGIVLRAGRYTRQNSWQPFFWCDVALRRDAR
ncbi:MAG: TIGR04283 family arsenosugar biosynthesis glycosyltransferase, partial [Gammaproteobacteria bacterium]